MLRRRDSVFRLFIPFKEGGEVDYGPWVAKRNPGLELYNRLRDTLSVVLLTLGSEV
jgi:hypothetical protein